jgi:gluconolactonase
MKGVYQFSIAGGSSSTLRCLSSALSRPNGLALSRDGSVLWVANSADGEPSWSAFEVNTDETCLATGEVQGTGLVNEQSLQDSLHLGPGLSDGFKIDESGNIWSTVPGGIAVIDPKKQEVLVKVSMGTNTSNIQFGDNGDVFVTGLGHIWRLKRALSK